MTTGIASLWPEHELAALAAPGAERRLAADERGLRLTSPRWQQLYRSKPGAWNPATLADCTADELEALCRLMGIAHSGTRIERIGRLLDMTNLRGELATWGEFQGVSQNAHVIASEIATRYRKPALTALARRAGVFISTTSAPGLHGLNRLTGEITPVKSRVGQQRCQEQPSSQGQGGQEPRFTRAHTADDKADYPRQDDQAEIPLMFNQQQREIPAPNQAGHQADQRERGVEPPDKGHRHQRTAIPRPGEDIKGQVASKRRGQAHRTPAPPRAAPSGGQEERVGNERAVSEDRAVRPGQEEQPEVNVGQLHANQNAKGQGRELSNEVGHRDPLTPVQPYCSSQE